MRLALLLLLPLAACASHRPEPYREPRKRDYHSLNKSSLAFLRETGRQERELRKRNFRRNWNWKELRRQNRRIAKESVKFFGESLFALELETAKEAWGRGLWRELRDKKDFWGSVRFGLLDSGD